MSRSHVLLVALREEGAQKAIILQGTQHTPYHSLADNLDSQIENQNVVRIGQEYRKCHLEYQNFECTLARRFIDARTIIHLQFADGTKTPAEEKRELETLVTSLNQNNKDKC